MCPHEQQHNRKSDQDEEALQDKLESLLVLSLAELDWLKESLDEREIKSLNAHLEQQKHSGDAEADEGAPNKTGHPHQTEL